MASIARRATEATIPCQMRCDKRARRENLAYVTLMKAYEKGGIAATMPPDGNGIPGNNRKEREDAILQRSAPILLWG